VPEDADSDIDWDAIDWTELTPPMDGVGAILGLPFLGDCSTIEKYCGKLRSWGATYYEDVHSSREANKMGLGGIESSDSECHLGA